MTSVEQGNTQIDTRHIIYTSSSVASKGLMNVVRPVEATGYSAIPVASIIRAEPVQERFVTVTRPVVVEVQREAVAAQLEVPAVGPISTDSNKASSEGSSETSYDSKLDKSAKNQVINLEENEHKPIADVANVNKEGEVVGLVEVNGFGNRGHYLSEGYVIFKILEANFRQNSKLDAKHKPYFKFRLGLNNKSSKVATLQGKSLSCVDEVKVKYTNQDQVRIKVKGKGKLVDNVIAQTKVSIVDVVMDGKQTVWAPLLKGDTVVGEMKLEMEFAPKK